MVRSASPLLMDVLARSKFSTVRIVAVSMLGVRDLAFMVGLSMLRDSPQADLMGEGAESEILKAAGALHRSGATVDALIESLLAISDLHPTCVVLRLLHGNEAGARLATLARDDDEPRRSLAVLYLPLIAQDSMAVDTLMSVLADPAVDSPTALRAGLGLASIEHQRRVGSEALPAGVVAELQRRAADRSLSAPARCGAGVALLHGREEARSQAILTMLSDASQDASFRALLAASCLASPPRPPWLFDLSFGRFGPRERIVAVLTSLALNDGDPGVRAAARR